jgi:lycopene beta-cyclase
MHQRYDYIIAGGGASGLSLAWRMLHSPLKESNILIVDTNLKPQNNKTWCFWHSGTPPFSDLIHKKWSSIEIGISNQRFSQQVQEYPYYGLRSIDFQATILKALQASPNIDLVEGQITKFSSLPAEDAALLHTQNGTYRAPFIFQSCFDPFEDREPNIHYPLKQHFLGWEVRISEPLFDETTCTLMDFDETFDDGVAFMYLLPWDKTSGLFEYTIFSDQLVSKELYEEKIALYLHNRYQLKPIDYEITRREYGVIPMQDRPVVPWYKPRILNIGTHGGLTKPSTGYTFNRIQHQTRTIVDQLIANGFSQPPPPSEFRFKAYDLWLLHILYNHPAEGQQIFHDLFQGNSMDAVFKFLNEDSSLFEDLKIMSSLPYRPFLKAIWATRKRIWEI